MGCEQTRIDQMRYLILVLLLIPAALQAHSYAPPLRYDNRIVGDGKFVYAQINEDINDEGMKLRQSFPWAQSGLYASEDSENPMWCGDLAVNSFTELFVSEDGQIAAVVDLSYRSEVRFYVSGELTRRWDLPNSARRVSPTDVGRGGLRSWWTVQHVAGFLYVSNRLGDQLTFLLRTAELVRRSYASYTTASPGELAAFEAALMSFDETPAQIAEAVAESRAPRLKQVEAPQPPVAFPGAAMPIAAVEPAGTSWWMWMAAGASVVALLGAVALRRYRRRI